MTNNEEKCLAKGQNAKNTFAATPTKYEIILQFFKELPLYRAFLAQKLKKSS